MRITWRLAFLLLAAGLIVLQIADFIFKITDRELRESVEFTFGCALGAAITGVAFGIDDILKDRAARKEKKQEIDA